MTIVPRKIKLNSGRDLSTERKSYGELRSMPEINKEFHSYEYSLLVKHNKRRIDRKSRPSFIEY